MCHTSLHFRDCNIHNISQFIFLIKYFTLVYRENYNKKNKALDLSMPYHPPSAENRLWFPDLIRFPPARSSAGKKEIL